MATIGNSLCVYSTFFSQNTRDWITTNGGLKSSQNAVGIPWNVTFSFPLWLIWKQQNYVVFNNRSVNSNLGKIITSQASEFFLCASQPRCNNRMVLRPVRWKKPKQGWLKLNTDGSWNATLGKAARGGLISDDLCNWVVGFSRKMGSVNSFTAEVWALRDGLMLCHQMKLPAINVELDVKALVDALSNPSYNNSVISPIFDDCKLLLSQIPLVHIKHIYREANVCADRLANFGHSQVLDFIIHSVSPVDFSSSVEADRNGVSCNKLCLVFFPSC